jgi:hypothetical protein
MPYVRGRLRINENREQLEKMAASKVFEVISDISVVCKYRDSVVFGVFGVLRAN